MSLIKELAGAIGVRFSEDEQVQKIFQLEGRLKSWEHIDQKDKFRTGLEWYQIAVERYNGFFKDYFLWQIENFKERLRY